MQPLVTAFGANLNSGLFYRAQVPKGFHLTLRVNGMGSIFSDEQRTFLATTEEFFHPVQEVETPTIVGDGMGTTVTGSGGTQYTFPGGYDLTSFGSAAPILTFGIILGTEFSVRFLPADIGEEFGKVSLLERGLRHSISQYIPLFPIDISAGIFYQEFEVGDILKSSAMAYHTEIGKTLSILNLYGGVISESFDADFEYTFTGFEEPEEVAFSINSASKFQTFVGLGFSFYLLHINADYRYGDQNMISAGVTIRM